MTDALPARGPEDGGSGRDYSLKVYADPATARTCLELQNQFGLDVNLLLFCLYAGHHGHALSTDDLRRLDQQVHAWRARRSSSRCAGSAAGRQVDGDGRRCRSPSPTGAADGTRRGASPTALDGARPAHRARPRDQKLAAANLAHYVDTLGASPTPRCRPRCRRCRLSTQTR